MRSTGNDHVAFKFKLCDMKIVVCWQDWRDTTEEIDVAMNKGCHDVELRKHHLGFHNSWDCWYFIWLLGFWVLLCVDHGSAY